ncbi:MAG: CDP-diacylglycerol--glycerol-3-phosphate 3-phosphatidyltransferase [Rubrobacteraceae bacterium]
MNLANQLTLARIVAILPLMVALYVPFPGHRSVVLVLYVAALLTDYFDGVAARRSNKVTGFGKLMDSIADKALIVSVFFALVELGLMASWMAAIMVIREFAVTGLRMVALESGEVIAANSWGKAKMNAQSLAVFILLLGYAGWFWPGFLVGLGWWLMVVAVILTLISGWSYLKDTPRILAVQSQRDQRL